MPATNAWNELAPAGSDLISAGDNEIRKLKLDVRERLNVEHVWDDSLATDGFHRNITIPSASALSNKEAVNIAGYALTGANAQSGISLAGVWNTSGVPTALKVNITDTASHASSLLADLQVGAVSMFRVGKTGNFFSASHGQIGGLLLTGSGPVTLTDATGKIVGINATTFASLNGAAITGVLHTGAGEVVDSDINPAAAIAWTKISKTGSSLADLVTRSATDLTSGTLPDARLSANVVVLAGAQTVTGDKTFSGATRVTGSLRVPGNTNGAGPFQFGGVGNPAITTTAVYGYLTFLHNDGSTVFVPCWK